MFKVGEQFSSLEEFEKRLHDFEHTNPHNFWKRDSCTLEAQTDKYPESVATTADRNLRYYSVELYCAFAEQKSNNNKQEKIVCPAKVLVKLSDCGKFLIVEEINESHNHPSSIKMKSEDEAVETGGENNFVSLKELSSTEKDFNETVEALKENHKCDVNILCDEEENILCLCFQDPEMKTIFNAYPELIFVEGTYCLNKNGPCIYTILGEDSEGNGTVFAVGVLLNENEEILDWFVNQFKEYNSNYQEIKVVLTDRDAPINPVLVKNFPEASLEIALFNTLNKFTNEISKHLTRKMDNKKITNLFEELVLSSSYDAFEEACDKFLSVAPQNVVEYYDKIWHPIKDLWVLYLTSNYQFSINNSSNRLEVVNQKIKSIILNFTNFEDFIQQVIEAIQTIRTSCVTNHYNRKKRVNSELKDYEKHLTNYAYFKIKEQFLKLKNLKTQVINKEKMLISDSEGSFEVTKIHCSCLFRITMNLPCSHLFQFRKTNNLPLYSEDLYTERWTRNFFESHHPFFTMEEKIEDPLSEYSNDEEATISDEKFKLMYDECMRLADICSELPDAAYNKRLEFLNGLIKKWTDFEDDEDDHEIFQDDGGVGSPGEYLLEVAEDEQEELMDDDDEEEDEEEDNDSDSDFEINGGSAKRKKMR